MTLASLASLPKVWETASVATVQGCCTSGASSLSQLETKTKQQFANIMFGQAICCLCFIRIYLIFFCNNAEIRLFQDSPRLVDTHLLSSFCHNSNCYLFVSLQSMYYECVMPFHSVYILYMLFKIFCAKPESEMQWDSFNTYKMISNRVGNKDTLHFSHFGSLG